MRIQHSLNHCGLVLFATLLTLISPCTYANDDLIKKMNDPANWASWGGNYQGTRYSELDQINADNVHQLELAWQLPTGVLYRHGGGPLVVDDIIYIHTPYPNKVIAFNQADQTIKWVYEPEQNAGEIFGENSTLDINTVSVKTFNHGLAYGEGMIFLHQADTALVALDAKTGTIKWSVKNGDPYIGSTISSAPLIVKDKVILGNYSNSMTIDDPGGYITAYYIKDGSLAWRGHSVGTDKKMLMDPTKTQTWTDGELQSVGKDSSINSWRAADLEIGGTGITGGITYDPDLNLLYYGSGAAVIVEPLGKDMRWTSALWARDVDTGEVKWVYQTTPNNTWSYSAENESILVEQIIKGTQRHTLVHFDSNGFVYTLDRETGELLLTEKYKENTNWASHIDLKTGRPQIVKQYKTNFDTVPTMYFEEGYEIGAIENVCPFAGGGYSGNIVSPTAYSPKNQLFYISSDNLCMTINASKAALSLIIEKNPNAFDVNNFLAKVANTLPDDHVIYTLFPTGYTDPNSYKLTIPRRTGYIEAWDVEQQTVKWRITDVFAIDSGPIVTAGNIVFYGTKYGYLNALDAETGDLLYQFKSPVSIVGNISTWRYNDTQYIGFYTSTLGRNSPETNTNSGVGSNACALSGGYPEINYLEQISHICTQIKKEIKGTFMVFSLKDELARIKQGN